MHGTVEGREQGCLCANCCAAMGMQVNGKLIRQGTELSSTVLRGRLRFERVTMTGGTLVVHVFDRKGMMRAIYPWQIKTVHRDKRMR